MLSFISMHDWVKWKQREKLLLVSHKPELQSMDGQHICLCQKFAMMRSRLLHLLMPWTFLCQEKNLHRCVWLWLFIPQMPCKITENHVCTESAIDFEEWARQTLS